MVAWYTAAMDLLGGLLYGSGSLKGRGSENGDDQNIGAPLEPPTTKEMLFGLGSTMREKKRLRREVASRNKVEVTKHMRTWNLDRRRVREDLHSSSASRRERIMDRFKISYTMKRDYKRAEQEIWKRFREEKRRSRRKLGHEFSGRYKAASHRWHDRIQSYRDQEDFGSFDSPYS